MPIVLFNSLSWERTDPVTTTLQFPKGYKNGITIVNKDKKITKAIALEIVLYLNFIKAMQSASLKSPIVNLDMNLFEQKLVQKWFSLYFL